MFPHLPIESVFSEELSGGGEELEPVVAGVRD